MNGSSTGSQSGFQRLAGVGRGLSGVREVIDQIRSPDQRVEVRADRSDDRAAVLGVLAERPASGYEIVRVLEERGRGARTPRAGAVYPTLQLLGDEGLATSDEADGRRTWTLTAAGRAAADAARERSDQSGVPSRRAPERRGGIARSGAQLAQAAALAAQSGTPEQVAEVVAMLDEARRGILSVLARG